MGDVGRPVPAGAGSVSEHTIAKGETLAIIGKPHTDEYRAHITQLTEGVPNIAAYAAAKGGVIAFAKSQAKELAGCGVTVNCIAPALTETPLLDTMTDEHKRNMAAKIPMGRLVQPDEIGELAAWIASPACSFTTGFVFDITGGRATY